MWLTSLRRVGGVPALALAFWVAQPAAAAELSGRPTVIDGETLEVAGRRVRLTGIDAPEPTQVCRRAGRDIDCGVIATAQLKDITAGATVACRSDGLEHAGLPGARCTAAGYDLAYGMVYAGWALADPGQPSRYATVEAEARAAGRGIWRYRFVPPWEWRGGKRLPAAE